MKHPEYDRASYAVWGITHPVVIHWVLNPGLAVVELIFGARMPKVCLVEKDRRKHLFEKSFLPCPHCGSIHDGRLWSGKNALGHWFGLLCPSCHKVIPCLWNLTSLIILAATVPIWFLPVRLVRPRWLEFEKRRFLTPSEFRSFPPPCDVDIRTISMMFGLVFWIVATLPVAKLCGQNGLLSLKAALLGLPLSLIAAMIFGAVLKRRPEWLAKLNGLFRI